MALSSCLKPLHMPVTRCQSHKTHHVFFGQAGALSHTVRGQVRCQDRKCIVAAGRDPNGGSPGRRRPGDNDSAWRRPGRRRRQAKADKPGMFEVVIASPPPRSLGIRSLPPKTHNGDQLSIEGKEYIVTSLILQYKLRRGRYVPDHSKVKVLPTGRFLYNEYLSAMMEITPTEGETGKQD